MNVAITFGASDYSTNLTNLPASKNDLKIIESLIKSIKKFDEYLSIPINTSSTKVKNKIIEFISSLQNKEIDELFFYFTGHGKFIGDDFYYILSDYDSKSERKTSLENSELDSLIKSINPTLTVKIVDACHSGVLYIKDDSSINTYLKGTQSNFQNCYFLYSSQSSQSSYQDDNLSFFTRSFLESISNYQGKSIRYKDVIDHISDEFANKDFQTPYFVTQASFTEPFCTVNEIIKANIEQNIDNFLNDTAKSSEEEQITLKELIEIDSKNYFSKKNVNELLSNILEKIRSYKTKNSDYSDIFTTEVIEKKDYTDIFNFENIGKIVEKEKSTFFIKPTYRKRYLKDYWEVAALSFGGKGTEGVDYDWIIDGIKSTEDLPYNQIVIKAISKYASITSRICIIIPIVSQTHIRLFRSYATTKIEGWDSERIDTIKEWAKRDIELSDKKLIYKSIEKIFEDFIDFSILPIMEHYGTTAESVKSPIITKE